MCVVAVVELILGAFHQVAVLSGTPPKSDDTICHGGTLSFDGLEISCTPLESVTIIAVVLFER
jgi:hypothetical protein